MTVVLLTGFEPFAGAARNPSWDAVERLAADGIPGLDVRAALLPVEFVRSIEVLRAAIDEHSPDLVIAVGLADGRDAITPERVGINVDDARIPDNGGDHPRDRAIETGGPDARFGTLPIADMVAAMDAAGIPGRVSNTAGTYVCNHVAYALPGMTSVPAGFVHVPATPETRPGDDETPTLELDAIVAGLRAAVVAAVRTTAR